MKFLSIFIICFILSGCTTIPSHEKRQAYINTHPRLSPETQEAILLWKVYVGMTKEEIMASWGSFIPTSQSCYSWGCYEYAYFQGWHLTFANDKLINMSQY